jgi:hypothetical protein
VLPRKEDGAWEVMVSLEKEELSKLDEGVSYGEWLFGERARL